MINSKTQPTKSGKQFALCVKKQERKYLELERRL